MNDFSLIEKLNILMKLITSSSLFLFCSIISTILLILLIICIVLNKKINKWVFIGVFSFIGLLIVITYGTTLIIIIDKIIDAIFMAMYFPNLPIYISVLVISNIYFIISIFSKKHMKTQKVVNIICSIILDLILIFVIDLVTKNNINLGTEINLYTNPNLLVLLQLSMGVFISSILINLILSAHYKLKKYDKVEEYIRPEIIFD